MSDDTKLAWKSYQRAMTKQGLLMSIQSNLEYALAKDQYTATDFDDFMALAISLRDRIVERWIKTQQRYHAQNVKRVYYLSLEFLIGRSLENNIYNLGLNDQVAQASRVLGLDLEEIFDQEREAGLGNGGLGRLAACFLESMATLAIPAQGYGIRYDYGIFKQQIKNGYQIELPDEWLKQGYPWEFCRPEYTMRIRFYGKSKMYKNADGKTKHRWVDTEDVLAVPYDVPVVGHKNNIVNTLRLWSAQGTEEFDLNYFNEGDYEQAVYQKIFSESISKVLYPNDAKAQGRELRLKQEYFITAASIADILRRYKAENDDITKLADKAVIQLNDTHPALAVVELMRILLDDYCLEWEQAWDITRNTFAYTNHTLLPEALECWSVELLKKVLPRHLQLIYEINEYFLNEVNQKHPGDGDLRARMSLIREGEHKMVQMANLSIIGSKSVNGVSGLHTELLKSRLFPDFDRYFPGKFNNKTNGITHRQWLLKANPPLAQLITDTIGDKWISDLTHLRNLEKYKDDSALKAAWHKAKVQNKRLLGDYVNKSLNIAIDPSTIFDTQIKRIHEYKRQLLFALYIFGQYLKLKNNPHAAFTPRTFIFAGKAAPGYAMAKLIIKFINSVADVINKDHHARAKMKILFLENYRVTLAERIIPATDLSEQISTAGFEASGTGNMKFMLNGALTIGTMDGANVEMAEEVGEENMFIFGLRANDVTQLDRDGYTPRVFIERSPVLKEIHTLLLRNYLSSNDAGLFDPIVQAVFQHDTYKICADFDAYCAMQDTIGKFYMDQDAWTTKSILNAAASGKFSSDRTIMEYTQDIWGIPPLSSKKG